MSKARDLADFVSDGNPLADGTISVSEVSGAAPTASPTFTGDATFDTDTLAVDSTNNNVGIGTTSPNANAKLTLSGGGMEVPTGYGVFNDSGGANATGINFTAAGTNILTFFTGNSERMRIDSSGNVGIGTSSPSGSIDVAVGSGDIVSNFDGSPMITYRNGTGLWFHAGKHPSDNAFVFTSGSTSTTTEYMRIDSSGNLDVGATNSSVFNGVGGNSRIVAKGSDTATNVANNSNASITIANDDGTANNLAGLHFARADTDDNPHYVGASIVAQFPTAQVTGQYPQGQLVFLTSTSQNSAPSEKLRISPEGAVGIGGANYGTAGQVLTSGGSGAAPSWQSVSFTTNVVTTNTTASKNNHYYLNAATVTLTLPASPSVGDEVRISEVAGNTDCVIGRNGSNIMGDASDLTIDTAYLVLSLRYVDATIGWAFS